MGVFRAFRILVSCVVIVGCAPERSGSDRLTTTRSVPALPRVASSASPNADRIRDLERRMADVADDRTNPDEPTEADLDARANADREMITSLNTELEIRRATDADEIRALHDRQEQESRVREISLADLYRQIQNQEKAVAEKRAASETAIAPEGGDLRNRVEGDLLQAENALNDLRAEYERVLSTESATPNQYYSEQRTYLDSLRSRQADVVAMIRTATADLENIARAKANLKNRENQRALRLRHLQEERNALSE